MHFFHHGIRLAAAVLLLSLTACASAPVSMDRPQAFAPGHGFVAIRVVTNTPTLDASLGVHFNRWQAMTVVDAADKVFYLVPGTRGGRNSSQLLIAQLPAGRYRLQQLQAPPMGKTIVASLAETGAMFEIKPSHITNLGTLIYQPTGNHGYTFLAGPSAADVDEAIARDFAGLRALAGGNPALGWSNATREGGATQLSGSSPMVVATNPFTMVVGTATVGVLQAIADRLSATDAIKAWQEVSSPTERYVMAKESTYAFNAVQVLPSGEVLAGSNLGQVLLRDGKGWRRLDTGDVREITAVHGESRDHIVVAGEEGLLLQTEDSGNSWQRRPAPVPGALIVHLARHPSGWFATSVLQDTQIVSFSTDLASGQWRELRRIPSKVEGWAARTSWHRGAVLVQDKYVVTTPSEQVHVLDIASGAWSVHATPELFRDVSGHGGLLVGTPAIGSAYASDDFGRSWRELPLDCRFNFGLAVASADTRYTLCLKVGMFVGSTRVVGSLDQGKTWRDLVEETPVIAHTLFAGAGNSVYYVDITGRVYASHDGGATWAVERRTFQ